MHTDRKRSFGTTSTDGGPGIYKPNSGGSLRVRNVDHNHCSTSPTNIVSQAHESPDDVVIRTLQQNARKESDESLRGNLESVKTSLPRETKRAVDLAVEKGSSNWLTVIPVKDMDFNLNKR